MCVQTGAIMHTRSLHRCPRSACSAASPSGLTVRQYSTAHTDQSHHGTLSKQRRIATMASAKVRRGVSYQRVVLQSRGRAWPEATVASVRLRLTPGRGCNPARYPYEPGHSMRVVWSGHAGMHVFRHSPVCPVHPKAAQRGASMCPLPNSMCTERIARAAHAGEAHAITLSLCYPSDLVLPSTCPGINVYRPLRICARLSLTQLPTYQAGSQLWCCELRAAW